MNIHQWLEELSKAYQAAGLKLSDDKKNLFLRDLSEISTQAEKNVLAEALEIMIQYFFRKASRGETFGPLARIKEFFGRSVEENYGLFSGPFINLAKTYWTYKLEVSDLLPQHGNLALSRMLSEIEVLIAAHFFPTPGPARITVSELKEAQRKILGEYAPDIDVERFLSENPVLRALERRGGCLGVLLVFVGTLVLFFLSRWVFLSG